MLELTGLRASFFKEASGIIWQLCVEKLRHEKRRVSPFSHKKELHPISTGPFKSSFSVLVLVEDCNKNSPLWTARQVRCAENPISKISMP